MEEFEKEWNAFLADFSKAEGQQLEYLQSQRQVAAQQEGCMKNVKHLTYVYRQLRNDLKNISSKPNIGQEELQGLASKKAQLSQMATKIAEMERELPVRDNGVYLSIILGSNLNISLLNPDERYRYKQEYESFKLSVNCVILALFLLAYWMPPFRVMDALCNFLLVWYYCTLTIRESILRLNGSRIKGWWVLHHYITCVLCGITLTWRDGECYERIRPLFAGLVCYIGSVQIFQYKYQTGCLRRLHALGQRHSMDITMEGFSSWMFKGLSFLLPFLIIGYFIQGYCSYYLFYMYIHMNCSRDWQVLVLAFLFAFITIGNSVTIAIVIVKKFAGMNRANDIRLIKYRAKAL